MASSHPPDDTVLETIRSLVGGARPVGIYECRRCGTSVDGPEGACPECGAEDVAHFLL